MMAMRAKYLRDLMQVQKTGEVFDEDQMLFCSINLKKMEENKMKMKKMKAEVDAMPPVVTCDPHPPTYIIPETRHDDDNG